MYILQHSFRVVSNKTKILQIQVSVLSCGSSSHHHKMGALLFIVAVLIAAVYLYLKKYYRFWSDRGFASAPSSFPFGSLKGVGTKFHKSVGLDIIYKKYKGKVPVVGIFSLFKPAVLLLDPELYKCILVKDFATFQDRGFYYDKQSDPLTAKQVE